MKEKKITMKLSRVLAVEALLSQYGDAKQAKLCYCIARNLNFIKPITEAFREATKDTDAIQKFKQEKTRILEQNALRDDNGRPKKKLVGGQSWVYEIEDEDKVQDEVKSLDVYEQAVADEEEIIERRKELLEQDEIVRVYQLPFDQLKEDEDGNLPINAAHLSLFLDFGIIV